MHFFLLIFTSLHHRRIIALASYNLRRETFLGDGCFSTYNLRNLISKFQISANRNEQSRFDFA